MVGDMVQNLSMIVKLMQKGEIYFNLMLKLWLFAQNTIYSCVNPFKWSANEIVYNKMQNVDRDVLYVEEILFQQQILNLGIHHDSRIHVLFFKL